MLAGSRVDAVCSHSKADGEHVATAEAVRLFPIRNSVMLTLAADAGIRPVHRPEHLACNLSIHA